MSLTLDLVEDAQVSHDSRGITVIRQANIRNVRAAPAITPRAVLNVPGLPRFGDPHPAFPNVRLVDVSLAAVDTMSWRATLTYREPTTEERIHIAPPGSVVDVSWFVATTTEEVVTDASGQPLRNLYVGRPVRPVINAFGTAVRLQRASTTIIWKNDRAEVQGPAVGARVTVTDQESVRRFIPLHRTVNRGSWAGLPPETWLLSGMDSRRERGRWINVYEFLYRAKTWRFESRVESFGSLPSDATLGNGIERFQVYELGDFGALGFEI